MPVIFKFSFRLGDGPELAAVSMARAAERLATSLGFSLRVPPLPLHVLAELPAIMGDLAAGIANAGGDLVLLIDEAQVSGPRTRVWLQQCRRLHADGFGCKTARLTDVALRFPLAPCALIPSGTDHRGGHAKGGEGLRLHVQGRHHCMP